MGTTLDPIGTDEDAAALPQREGAAAPESAEALFKLGNALKANGHLDEAIDAFRRANALDPGFPEVHNNLGNALNARRNFDEATAACQQAISLRPGYAEAHNTLGNAFKGRGRLDDAIAAYRRAIAIKPELPEGHCNLGTALQEQGQVDEAIAAFGQAIALRPNYSEAHNRLGCALTENGRLAEAIDATGRAIAIKGGYAEAYYNLGLTLKKSGQFDRAIAAYRRAIELDPRYAEAHNNLGSVLRENGRHEEAIAAYRQAIALRPNDAEGYNNIGLALREIGRIDESIAAGRQGIRVKPDCADVHFNLAIGLLLRGDLEQGWREYEWRWKCRDLPSERIFPQPRWTGEPLDGRTILIHAEQGLGDTIQFVRFLPMIAERGGKVVLGCQPNLHGLIRTLPGEFSIVPPQGPLPAFDVHCPLLTLPLVLGTTPPTMPRNMPYLFADNERLEVWRNRIAEVGAAFKVGLAWAGNPTFVGDRTRSLSLDRLAALAGIPSVTFYSVQKGYAEQQIATPPAGMPLINLGPELNDFADTAAVMANMDLILTTDTSVAHLAGALGRPTWVMLQYVPDWRWFLDRQDSPWYPAMRLFRQPARGDWQSVIRKVAEELARLAEVR